MWIRLGVLAFLGLLCWAWLGLLRPMLIANRVAAISIGEEQIQEALRPRSIQFIEEARRKPITTHVAMPMPNAGQGGKFTTEAELKPAESLLLGLVPWANTLLGLLVLKVTRRSDGRMEMNAELLSAADGAKAAERLQAMGQGSWIPPRALVVDGPGEQSWREALRDWNSKGPLAIGGGIASEGQEAFLLLEPEPKKILQIQWSAKVMGDGRMKLSITSQFKA